MKWLHAKIRAFLWSDRARSLACVIVVAGHEASGPESGLVTFQATERHFAMGTFCCLVRTSNLSLFVLPDSHDGQSGLGLNGFMAFNFLCVGNCCRVQASGLMISYLDQSVRQPSCTVNLTFTELRTPFLSLFLDL